MLIIILVTLCLISVASATKTSKSLTQRVIIKTFQQYDFHKDKLHDVECLIKLDRHLCPEEDRLPCGGMDKVEKHCQRILGYATRGAVTGKRSADDDDNDNGDDGNDGDSNDSNDSDYRNDSNQSDDNKLEQVPEE